MFVLVFLFKQKTAYEMRISDWSSDVCSSDLSIVLLAMIAAFLGMRLYSVLGKRTGHEQEPVLPRRDERVVPLPVRRDDADTPSAPRDAAADTSGLVYEPAAEAGLRAQIGRAHV